MTFFTVGVGGPTVIRPSGRETPEGREESRGEERCGRPRLEGHREHRRHVGKGAGPERDAVDKADDERGEVAAPRRGHPGAEGDER